MKKNNLETKIKKILIFLFPAIYLACFVAMLVSSHFAAAVIFAVAFCASVARWWKTFAEDKYDFVSEQ